MFVTETVLEAMAGYFEFTRYIIDVWGLAANIDSKSRKKIMNATIFQHIGSLLSGHHPYSQRDSLDTANSVTNVFFIWASSVQELVKYSLFSKKRYRHTHPHTHTPTYTPLYVDRLFPFCTLTVD